MDDFIGFHSCQSRLSLELNRLKIFEMIVNLFQMKVMVPRSAGQVLDGVFRNMAFRSFRNLPSLARHGDSPPPPLPVPMLHSDSRCLPYGQARAPRLPVLTVHGAGTVGALVALLLRLDEAAGLGCGRVGLPLTE